jgi:hypothetical protein
MVEPTWLQELSNNYTKRYTIVKSNQQTDKSRSNSISYSLAPQQQQQQQQPLFVPKTEPEEVVPVSSRSESIRNLNSTEIYQNNQLPHQQEHYNDYRDSDRERYASQSDQTNPPLLMNQLLNASTGYNLTSQQHQQHQPQDYTNQPNNYQTSNYQYGSQSQLYQPQSYENRDQYQQKHQQVGNSQQNSARMTPNEHLNKPSGPQLSYSSNDITKVDGATNSTITPSYYSNSQINNYGSGADNYDRANNYNNQSSQIQPDQSNYGSYGSNNAYNGNMNSNSDYNNYNYNNAYQPHQQLQDSTRASSTTNQFTHESTPGKMLIQMYNIQ